jgi:hypothetical protein
MGLILKIKEFFSVLLRKFKKIVEIAFPIARRIFIAKFFDFALKICMELKDKNLSGESKRKEAFATIKSELIQAGEEFKDSLINALIEICVSHIKAKAENEEK